MPKSKSAAISETPLFNVPRFYPDKLACAVAAAMLAFVAPHAWADGGAGGDGVLNSTAGGAAGTADTSGGGTSVNGYVGGIGGNAGGFGGDGAGAASSGGDNSSSPGGGSTTSLFAGGGGAGGNGGTWGGGGGGGGGATNQKTSNTTFTLNSGTVSGGNGGRGGNGVVSGGTTYSTGGGGGAGGSGLILTNTSGITTVTIGGLLRGGDGGNAGAGILSGFGAEGGDGGYGLVMSGSAHITVSAGGEIRGGSGGNGAVDASGVVVGRGGRGEIGILLNGANNTIVNDGTISGGNGGDGGRDPGNTRYSAGTPQIAIAGANATIINSGTIQGGLSGDGVTRALAIQLGGSNNRLELRDGSNILGTVQINGGGTLALGGTADTNFDVSSIGPTAQYRGFTAYEKTGSGTATLTNSTISDTPWKLVAGTLSIDSDDALGASAGALTFNGGTLRITGANVVSTRAIVANGADAIFEITQPQGKVTLGGVIDGNGGLVVNGSGTAGNVGILTLTGANTYTGTTTVDNYGQLMIGDGGTQGSIVSNSLVINNGVIGFSRSDDVTYGGTISGTGTFGQAGTGKLTLTGDSSAFAGIALVASGTLQVDNKLGGRIGVFGGTLMGTGEVGLTQVSTGATLAPGSAAAPTGTLTVDNILVMTPGSTLRVTALPDGTNSKVVVNGMAQLAGSVMQMGSDGTYAASTTYNILHATSGVSGTFDAVNSNYAYLNPSLTYDANNVNLVVNLKDLPVDPGNGGDTSNTGGGGSTRPIRFADLADTSNQRSVANALQSLPANSSLYTRVLNLPNGAPADVFESLSGEAHASVSNTLNGVANNVVSLPMAHLRSNMDAGQRPGQPTAQLGRGDASSLPQSAAQPMWAQVFGNWRTLGGGNGTNEVSQSDAGVFAGGDYAVGGGWRLGGALGYTDSHSSIKGLSSHADVNSYSGIVYGGKAFQAGRGKINLSLGAAYTWHDIDTDRSVNAAGVAQDLTSSYSASTAQLFTELGYAMPLTSSVTLEPYVGADYSDQRTRGFSESGGDAALMGQSSHDQVGSTTLGLRAQTTFESGNSEGRLFASAGWRHSYGDLNPSTTMSFDGSQSFNVVGAPIARDAAVMSLGVDMAVTRRTTVGLTYGGQFGGGNRQNSGSLDVRWRF